MSKNIYVGNLSFETTNNDLETTFAAFGPVKRRRSPWIARRDAVVALVLSR